MAYWIDPETDLPYGTGFRGKIVKANTFRNVTTDILLS
jgi:hypothetical protein